MTKYLSTALFLGCLTMSSVAFAQLSANPWVHPNGGYFQDVAQQPTPDNTVAPVYEGNESNGEILPVDPWAKTRDTSGVKTWRGSGQHGKLNYIGEATSWDGTHGTEQELMPEVNRHNMLVFTEHLRKMGYKIPDSYDQNIKNMPQNYKKQLQQSFADLNKAEDPLSDSFKMLMNSFEDGTGLDVNNLIFNTMDILGTD
ncbi:MAG: hypothetical protein IJ545_03325 [Alphaproteobacteria bacterium]|nr:hypothetical protein [Alphaproteobacteria bacterium]